jgi:hypothetical protein
MVAFGKMAYGKTAFGRMEFGTMVLGGMALGTVVLGTMAFGKMDFGKGVHGKTAFGRMEFGREGIGKGDIGTNLCLLIHHRLTIKQGEPQSSTAYLQLTKPTKTMGLDQFVTAHKTARATARMLSDLDDEGLSVTEFLNGDASDVLVRVNVPVAQFRKFNALHGFISKLHATKMGDGYLGHGLVDNDSCTPYDITNMLDDLGTVVDIIQKEPDKAKLMFPPTEGFFFGSMEVDEGYWEDVQELKELVPKLRDLVDNGFTIEYMGWY